MSLKRRTSGALLAFAALAVFAHPAQAQSVTVSFAAASYTAEEGGAVEITVTLSSGRVDAVEIPITATNGNGATDADYSGVPDSVTFEEFETSKTFSFSATSDSDDDAGETVTLGFGTALPSGVSVGTVASAVVTITPDTTAPTFVSAKTSGNGIRVIVTFSEDIGVIPIVETLADRFRLSTGTIIRFLFSVTVDGYDVLPLLGRLSGAELTLTLESPGVESDQDVKVRYNNIFTQEPPGAVTDLFGHPLATFGDQDVENRVSEVDSEREFVEPPVLSKTELALCLGGTGTYGVKLPSQPSGQVGVGLVAGPPSVIHTTPGYLSFTPENWDTYQTVTVHSNEYTYEQMPDGVTNFWGATGQRISGVPLMETFDSVVRVLIRDSSHDECPS